MLLLRPLRGMAPPGFDGPWAALGRRMDGDWRKAVQAQHTLSDGSLALTVPGLNAAAVLGLRALQCLRRRLDRDGRQRLLPLQVVIVEPFDPSTGAPNADWPALVPGRLHVRQALAAKMPKWASAPQAGDSDFVVPFPDTQILPPLFAYPDALALGRRPPCFYCGHRDHAAAGCPSKQDTGRPQAFEALGRVDPDGFNRRFFEAMQTGLQEPASAEVAAALRDLSYVYQLRCLQHLWRSEAADWETFLHEPIRPAGGGALWLAQDCLRAGHRAQARKLLSQQAGAGSLDFRMYCLEGFLQVEEGGLVPARMAFQKALTHAERPPQKIFVLFLLLRLHRLAGDSIRAQRTLSRILATDRHCAQAEYEMCKLQLADGLTRPALKRLARLIDRDRSYFVAALIDPELAPCARTVQQLLAERFTAAGERALRLKALAEETLARVKDQLGAALMRGLDPETAMQAIDAHLATESYFGHLDAADGALRLASAAERLIESHKRSIFEALKAVAVDLHRQMTRVATFPDSQRMAAVHCRLAEIRASAETLRDALRQEAPQVLQTASDQVVGWTETLEQTGHQIERIWQTDALWRLAVTFLRSSLALGALNTVLAIFLLPLAAHYLAALFPALNLPTQAVWHWQKLLLGIGGLAAVFVSLVHTAKRYPRIWPAARNFSLPKSSGE